MFHLHDRCSNPMKKSFRTLDIVFILTTDRLVFDSGRMKVFKFTIMCWICGKIELSFSFKLFKEMLRP